MKDVIITLASVAGACMSFLAVVKSLKNSRLKKRLLASLHDNLRQYKLEEMYCHELLEAYGGTSHLAIKRAMRLKQRMCGQESPSSECTPHRIMEEIAKL